MGGQRQTQLVHQRAGQIMAVVAALLQQAFLDQAGQHSMHRGLVLLAGHGKVGQAPAHLRARGHHAQQLDASGQALRAHAGRRRGAHGQRRG
ncbi:hypothetical protein D3C71_1634470 [compost metagenome]